MCKFTHFYRRLLTTARSVWLIFILAACLSDRHQQANGFSSFNMNMLTAALNEFGLGVASMFDPEYSQRAAIQLQARLSMPRRTFNYAAGYARPYQAIDYVREEEEAERRRQSDEDERRRRQERRTRSRNQRGRSRVAGAFEQNHSEIQPISARTLEPTNLFFNNNAVDANDDPQSFMYRKTHGLPFRVIRPFHQLERVFFERK